MMIVNEELEYVLETIRFKTSIYRDKKKRNLTFNDDDYYSNILNEYITNLQQENARLKDKIDKAVKYIKTNCKEWENDDYDVTLYYSLNQNECDELLELLKEN